MMRFLSRRFNPVLVLGLGARLLFFDVAAWALFRQATTSPVTLVAFILGGTILSYGVRIRLSPREPLPADPAARIKSYHGMPLSDQSRRALMQ